MMLGPLEYPTKQRYVSHILSARALFLPACWGLPARQQNVYDSDQSYQASFIGNQEGGGVKAILDLIGWRLGHPEPDWLGLSSSFFIRVQNQSETRLTEGETKLRPRAVGSD